MTTLPTLAAVVIVVALASAQDRVPPSRVLRDMEVAGAAAFDRDTIARTLVADEPTLRALRRSLDGEVAAAVAERVEELHWRGGYAEAKARGDVVDGKLRIDLQAGRRYRCGEVRCTGNSILTTERIRAGLAEKIDWRLGDFPTLGGHALRRAVAAVDDAYRELGRYGVSTRVTFVPDGEAMVLDVAIADEGHEARVRSLSLEGDDDAHRDAVLAAVQFTPEMLATKAAIAALRRQFEQTGRYANVQIDVLADAPAVLDPLKIVVKVRAGAGALDRLAARDVAQLRSAFDVELARLQEGVPIQVALAIRTEMSWGRFRLQPGRVVFAFSKNGFAATAEHVVVGNGPPARAAAFLTPDELTIAFGERVGRWVFDRPIGVQFQMTSTLGEQGAGLRWGLGVWTGDVRMMAVDVHPGIAAYLLAQASEVRRDGDELALRFGDTNVRLAATGEVVGDRVQLGAGDWCTIALRSAPLAERRRALLPATATNATPEAASIVLDMLAAIVADAMDPAARADARVQALLRSGVGQIVMPVSTELAKTDEYAPLLGDGVSSMAAAFAVVASIPAVDRSFRGRIVDLSAAFAPLLQGDTRSAATVFEAILANKEHGPVSLAIVAALLHVVGNERGSASFAKVAADRLGFGAFYADAADLGANVPLFTSVPTQVGARWRAQPELREMFAGLPDGEAGDVAAWRKGLELLWNGGGERLLRDALSAK